MNKQARILIVDHDGESRRQFQEILEGEGFFVITVETGTSALACLRREAVDLVFTDYDLPGQDGLALLDAIRALTAPPAVIFVTAYGTIDSAVEAIKRGALGYMTKPPSRDRLLHLTRKAIDEIRLRQENEALRRELERRYTYQDLIGKSPKMQEVFQLLENLSGTESSVLIQGKSGTGKELVARAVHSQSPRRDHRFVALNCGGLSETLLESELFGYVRGAFTGALTNKRGLFQEADGGSLFLDEICNMPPPMQVKLLRTLQEGEIKPVGSNQTIRVDVRYIAASNRDLAQEVADGRFREDLYYRMNVITIALPDLAERAEDIPLLAAHFLDRFTKKLRKPVERIGEDAMALLLDHTWPGNVRELENCIERAVVLAKGPVITANELPPAMRAASPKAGARLTIGMTLAELEKEAILRALAHTDGNRANAAKMLGLSERTLYRKLSLYAAESSPPPR
ncbi:MAG: sigma-54-dependent Fis family transcriptional regulator [candidate division NC10 bacterium]|nr:sigma-54-dependent Fis family transcriptional regulator [candidate division NC10 bacterium]